MFEESPHNSAIIVIRLKEHLSGINLTKENVVRFLSATLMAAI